MRFEHEPVMTHEVLHWLDPRPDGIYVDGTVGGGGHSAAIMKQAGPTCTIVGIDRDPAALDAARQRLDPLPGTVKLFHANFRDIRSVLARAGLKEADGIVFDLGVSSHQLEAAERGFTYQDDVPLDMRMDPTAKRTARDLVNVASEQELRRIISEYGEERWASRIADFIVRWRESEPIETTGQLVDVIKAAIPAAARRRGPHPAKRTFQALRVAVNEELDSLQVGLDEAVACLAPGARICVISFHSLEDRIVKHRFSYHEQDCVCPPGLPVCRCDKEQELVVLTRSPVQASPDEVARNPRARSAKLRAAEKVTRVGS